MANRRMFSKNITSSSEFLMMSQSAQNLYFHFGMSADDDGFCEVFTVMRMTDSKPDDLRALHERGFIYIIDSKICIVKDWHENNQLRLDRYVPSKYLLDDNISQIYHTIMEEKIKHLSQYKEMATKWQPNGNQRLPQGSVVEGSIGKVRLIHTCADCFDSFWSLYPNKVNKKKAEIKFDSLGHELHKKILIDLPKRKKSEGWSKENGRFVPHPTTYLNGYRWEDEIVESSSKVIDVCKLIRENNA